jgi:hypothetical protein
MHLANTQFRPTAKRPRRSHLVSVCVGAMLLTAVIVSLASLAFASDGFPDVPATHPYFTAINDLASRNIIGGKTDGKFWPDDPVTRQQFAKMIVGTGGYPVSESDVCAFVDVQKSDASTFYPDNFVAVCAAKGITTGKTATTFDPTGNITRYQVISMVVRAADNLQPGLLAAPPAEWAATGTWGSDPTHGANARRAEYNGLLQGLLLAGLNPGGNMTRGEVAQVLHNLLGKLAPATTTTIPTTTTTNPPGHFENLGGIWTSGPGVCEHPAIGGGALVVFARGTDGAIWITEHKEGSWYDWSSVGGASSSDPATAGHGDIWSGVFWRGTDNAIWYTGWSSGWWPPRSLGGTFNSGPAVAMMSETRVDVFARGSDNALYHNRGSGTSVYFEAQWSWSGWEKLGGVLNSDPAAVSWGSDRIDVFARGTDNALIHIWWNGATWSEWENLGGTLTTGPGVASVGNGRLDVFAGGPGGALWHKKCSNGTWSAWENLGGVITSDPDAVGTLGSRIDVFARGADNVLLRTWWDGSAWRP